jgi:hypothetical protein
MSLSGRHSGGDCGSPHAYSSDVAFSPSVKAVQTRKGSRRAYHHVEERGSWKNWITPDMATFVAAQTSIFLAQSMRKDSLISSTAAARPASCGYSTTRPSALSYGRRR